MAYTPTELGLRDIAEKYRALPDSPAYARLYEDSKLGHMFAVLHEKLNEHFEAINGRAETTNHYWAENSREFLKLIKDVKEDLYTLKISGIEVKLDARYWAAIERCQPWLSQSGGSQVPRDFQALELVKYEKVFVDEASHIQLKKKHEPLELKMIGSGSYANVYSYIDPDYGIKFAVKRAKSDIEDRDLERFRHEFNVMKHIRFPYILEVYKFDESRNEYSMEFCDTTLREYISKRNNQLAFPSRKRIALQFLYGINYIHTKGLVHRDLSLQNVLVKVYDSSAVLVKLSDFGLVKEKTSDFTRTHTEMRGTIIDPVLVNFKDYEVLNEIYSIGHILSFIFTGRTALNIKTDEVSRIIHKCVALNLSDRYQSVIEIIADIERLEISGISMITAESDNR